MKRSSLFRSLFRLAARLFMAGQWVFLAQAANASWRAAAESSAESEAATHADPSSVAAPAAPTLVGTSLLRGGAAWSARGAHNAEVAGSNPARATTLDEEEMASLEPRPARPSVEIGNVEGRILTVAPPPESAQVVGTRTVADVPSASIGGAADGIRVQVTGGAEQVVSSQSGPKTRPWAELAVSGPLGFEDKSGAAVLRGFTRLRFTSLPGARAIDPAAVDTFQALEVQAGLGLRLGAPIIRASTVTHRDANGNETVVPIEQRITRALYLRGGFATRLPGDPVALDKTSNHLAVVFRVAEERSGAYFEVGYSPYHEGAGEDAVQAIVAGGAIPLSGTGGVVVVGGSAVIPLGRTFTNYYTYGGHSRPVVNYGVGIDLGMLFR